MGVFGTVIVITCASFLIGIVIGYNQGFKECTELFKKVEKNMWNSAIDDFAKSLKTDYVNFDLYYILQNNNFAFENTSLKSYQDMIDELAEQLKG